jgi:NADH-quinone oxidoreductase subunit H
VVVFVGKCLVLAVFGVALLRTAMGRMRIDQAFAFFLKWPGALGVASLIVVLLGRW